MLSVFWWAAIGGGLMACGLGLYLFTRWLRRHEPYLSFMRLNTRQKLRFFRGVLADRRVPWAVKLIPIALVLYLALPVDLIPDFIPVLGYLDDVALALVALFLVIRLLPRPVVYDLLHRLLVQGEGKGEG
jgi:uncharacterized membrane protein YkvA (DUF1232 family)